MTRARRLTLAECSADCGKGHLGRHFNAALPQGFAALMNNRPKDDD
jgi:hypothetical protein